MWGPKLTVVHRVFTEKKKIKTELEAHISANRPRYACNSNPKNKLAHFVVLKNENVMQFYT